MQTQITPRETEETAEVSTSTTTASFVPFGIILEVPIFLGCGGLGRRDRRVSSCCVDFVGLARNITKFWGRKTYVSIFSVPLRIHGAGIFSYMNG